MVVVGDIFLHRNTQVQKIETGLLFKENDTIIVSENSKIKIEFEDSMILYVNSNTKLVIGSLIKNSAAIYRNNILFEGDIYFSQRNPDKLTVGFMVSTALGSIATLSSDVSIRFKPLRSELMVNVLSGSVSVTGADKNELAITSCQEHIIRGAIDQSGELLTNNIDLLKKWVGQTIIEEAVNLSGCSKQNVVSENLPPEWKRLPLENCSAGELFIDTVEAVDPDSRIIRYELVSGPDGMAIDSNTGVIQYKPGLSESAVIIKARDDADNTIEHKYQLTVSSSFIAAIAVPYMVKRNEPFTIQANPSGTYTGKQSDFTYRFDCNGDGVFEYPVPGKFGPDSFVKGCVLSQEGKFKITVEISDKSGKTARASKYIIVNEPPKATFTITPSTGLAGSVFVFDATASSDSYDSANKLLVRFDINGDGIWDLPSDGGFLRDKKISYTWNDIGIFKVLAQVVDGYGTADTASAGVIVGRGVAISALMCPDTVHVGDTVRLECKMTDHDVPYISFEWSLDNDTLFEKKTNVPVFKNIFLKEGMYTVRCKVTDKLKMSGMQQKSIIVVNSESVIDAGGPYTTGINVPVQFKGNAQDRDSKIISYYWDFNGDGLYESTSPSNSSVSYTFTRSGKKVVTFSIETEDGLLVSDSAVVEVTNKAPTAKAGEDLVSERGKKLHLKGSGEDPDGTILSYEWDFDGDGKVDWSSAVSGEVKHEFETYSTAIFSILDSDSARSSDSLIVIICPEGMQTIESGKYCIDSYEYPNKKGEMPRVNVSYEEARKICAQDEKRLCTSQEWETACRNENKNDNFPYGKTFLENSCNTQGNVVVKNKVAVSGHFYECNGSKGIFDMSGNVAEWTESGKGDPWAYGGSYQNGSAESKCNSRFQLQDGRKYFYVGLRCCK
jgi:plastocyanin